MLGQSFDVNEILNLIKRAIFILKRPDIYQDFNVYKVSLQSLKTRAGIVHCCRLTQSIRPIVYEDVS